MNPSEYLIFACTAMVILTFAVGMRLLQLRMSEMARTGVPLQNLAHRHQASEHLKDTRALDNFSNLFEVPVLFYALCAIALATSHIPNWLPSLAWLFVILRVVHSLIHCTYNNVMHRFLLFMLGFLLLTAMWVAFAISINLS
ncbi:hypothetical conserved protein [Candidatus Nitrosoglobus terrae]|uniref:Hypothetical conserved protein n=1 Tax=Candidatus Nitrosoglobus terrae TaxID=1630141 RepID=A0A1Q2SL67_9GAMM|nr:MAPEG family protein [Candidatus Nitrosoglobus terrae]BAW79852.1 hypothetical conserved protein [Candidatus Nitrosoglobus terrae]